MILTRPESWPVWAESILAKSAPYGAGIPGELLPSHTWNVLLRLSQLAEVHPTLPEVCGNPALWQQLFWGCFLHDFGKAAAGFQRQLATRGRERWGHRHEVLSLAFVDWLDLGKGDALAVSTAVGSHHKDFREIWERYSPIADEEDDGASQMLADLPGEPVRLLWRWLSECAGEWAETLGIPGVRVPALLPVDAAIAGLRPKRIHGHVRRYRDWAEQLAGPVSTGTRLPAILLRGLLMTADHSASAEAPPFRSLVLDVAEILDQIAGKPAIADLPEHQQAAAEHSGNLVLTAPTGSGKTEAALLWAARQHQEAAAPRLFYTLPYQASMNAMLDRLQLLFGVESTGLQHGRALFALYRRLMDGELSPREALHEAKERRDLARLHVPPVRVMSPYQILKAAYRLKGFEALLADCYGGLFILDEVHAYEPKRLALILGLVRYLRESFSARFAVISATVAAPIRLALNDALGGPGFLRASDQTYADYRRHRLYFVEGDILDPRFLQEIIGRAGAGDNVLVCLTTVDRARNCYRAIRDMAPDRDVILVHGRFTARDRLAKERLIQGRVGLGTAGSGLIVVSTQVVEVSLNIDLDVLYSDPAPLEALLQRFGRVNRKGRLSEAPVLIFSEPADGQHVYDPELLEAAVNLLREMDGRLVDERLVEGWLDEVYQGQILERWENDFRLSAEQFEVILTNIHPFESAEPEVFQAFYRLFDGVEVLPGSLIDEYNEIEGTSGPLATAELFVPLSWGQLKMIESRGLARQGEEESGGKSSGPPFWIVDLPYNSEDGLDLAPSRSGRILAMSEDP